MRVGGAFRIRMRREEMQIGVLYRQLKSRRGGISGLVLEITVTAFMLMLILVVVNLFRSNMNIIGKTAQKTDAVDKIKSQVLMPLDKNQVSGSEIISVIRYYAKAGTASIRIVRGVDTHTYISEDYDAAVFSIPRDVQFTASYTYAGSEISSISYVSE